MSERLRSAAIRMTETRVTPGRESISTDHNIGAFVLRMERARRSRSRERRNVMRRNIAFIFASLLVIGCTSDEEKRPVGSPCDPRWEDTTSELKPRGLLCNAG